MLKLQKPESLVGQIYRNLSQAIMDGSLKPGLPLKEQELQRNLGVSRAPIREAIRLLQADRLVVVSTYKEKYVRRITRDDLLDVIPVLACLEGCAARLAVQRMGSAQIEAFLKIDEKMAKAHLAGDTDLCNELNFEFHKLYVKASGNGAVKQAIRPLVKRDIRLWVTTLYRQKPELFETTIREHEKILEAFSNRKARRAENAVREHIENVLQRALRASAFDKDGNFKIS